MKRNFITIFFVLSFALAFSHQAAAAPTYISGDVYGKWTTFESPYIVTGEVIVSLGHALTIEAGVTVSFESNKKMTVQGGTLTAIGTTLEPIVFTASVEGTPGFWDSMNISSSNKTRMEHCVIKYAKVGLYISDSAISVESCLITRNTEGIRISSTSPGIMGCDICSNESRGIFSQNADLTAKGNRIFDNAYGIYVSLGGSCNIRDNAFNNNSSYQIYLYSAGTHKIHSNTIEALSGTSNGIYVYGASEIKWNFIRTAGTCIYINAPNTVVEGNDILSSSSSNYGMYLTVNATDAKIIRNSVRGNTGINASSANLMVLNNYIYNSSFGAQLPDKVQMTGNTLKGCTQAIAIIGGGQHIIKYNNFIGNTNVAAPGADSMGAPKYLEYNYFGSETGPGGTYGAPGGTGDPINNASVLFSPYLTATAEDSPPGTINTLRLFKDKNFATELSGGDKVGILGNFYISAEGGVGSSETINWITLRVSSDAHSEGITVELTETGKNTGIYNGSVRIASYSLDFYDHIQADGSGQKVYVSGFGLGKALTVSDIATWEAAETPQRLKATLTVPTWSRLVIEPGVTVEVASSICLQVLGTLEARGTKSQRITFKPLNPNTNYSQTTRWGNSNTGGIYFNGESCRNSVIENCDVYGAAISVFVYLASSGKQSGPMIKHCVFSDSSIGGVFVRDSNPIIFGNTFARNNEAGSGSYGLFIYLNATPLVAGNTFTEHAAYVPCILVSDTPAKIRYNNFKGNNPMSYAVKNSASNKLVDAAHNYFGTGNNNFSGPVLTYPSLEAEVSSSREASYAAHLQLMEDGDFLSPLPDGAKLGALNELYISAEGDPAEGDKLNCMEVLITSESNPQGIAGYLIETSPASGIFHGDALITCDLSRMGFGYIKATGEVHARSFISPEASDSTGLINLTTWEGKVSLINGNAWNFMIPGGSTLHIKPGTTIEAANANSLLIKGTLISSGEPENKIRFTSAFPSKSAGNWSSIWFYGAGSGSIIRDSIIEYAANGVNAENGSSPQIENSYFTTNNIGIYARNNSHPLIRRNTILSSISSGIVLDPATGYCGPKIHGNVISSSGSYGIWCKAYSNYGCAAEILGNSIENNSPAGIKVDYPNPRIHYNNFKNNTVAITNSSGKVIDASRNYLEGNTMGSHIISEESLSAQITFEAAPSITNIRIKKDKTYLNDAEALGLLNMLYISAEGDDGDAGKINYADLRISSESYPAGISVLLFESGAASGVYNGAVRIVADDLGFIDNYDEIKAVPGDHIWVNLADNPGIGDSINVISVSTLEPANNPHRFESHFIGNLTRNYKIPGTSTLFILPGTTIESGAKDLLLIQGILIATGEASGRILFTSSDPIKSPGDWAGIRFSAAPASCIVRYSDIKYAEEGIGITGAASPRIFANNIENNLKGLCFSGLSGSSNPRIADNRVINNQESGAVADGALSSAFKVNYNNVYNSSFPKYGMKRTNGTSTANARYNFWGNPSGPKHSSNPSGNPSSEVTDDIDFLNYSTVEITQGGPVVSGPSPLPDSATNYVRMPITLRIFDPEDVAPQTITLKITTTESATYNTADAHVSYDMATATLTFEPSVTPTIEFPEGKVTVEVLSAVDTMGTPLSAPYSFYFIVDLSSPEVEGASAAPDPAKAGTVQVTVEFTDLIDRMDNLVSPEVWIAHSLGSIEVKQSTYAGFIWSGTASIPTAGAGQGNATIEVYKASDRAGNELAPSLEAGLLFIDTVKPAVTLESPNGGETLVTETPFPISWEVAVDPQPSKGLKINPVSLYYTTDNGITYNLIASGLLNTGSYTWTVPPMMSSEKCRVKISAEDLAGNFGEDVSSGTFEVEVGYPFIVSTVPSNGAAYVSRDANIFVMFNETVATSSAQSAFSIWPYTGGSIAFADADATMIFDPAPTLEANTTYTVTIESGVLNLLGNPMLSTYSFNFSTGTTTGESIPPTISRVRINGRAYFFNDVISSKPIVEATVTDEVGGSGVTREGISMRFGPYSIPEVNTYDGEKMSHQITEFPIGPGTYVLTIEARDRAGNRADFSGQVRIIYGDAQIVGGPLAYPMVFKPLSGGNLTIAYDLSTDADIAVFIYDVGGKTVLTKKFRKGSPGGATGYNSFDWNGIMDTGGVLGNGIYVYKIISKNKVIGTGKIVVYD
jgi:hypothetical protein